MTVTRVRDGEEQPHWRRRRRRLLVRRLRQRRNGRARARVVGAAIALLHAAGLLIAGGRAWAHDPFQITTDARVHRDRVDVRIVMLDDTAAKLCVAPDAGRLKLDAASFESWRPRFEACGAGLYRISDGEGALAPRQARARLSVENDVELDLVYPPPRRGPLRFDAVHLRRIPDPTYGAELTVTGDGTFLGQALLRADQSTLDISDPFGAPSPAGGQDGTAAPTPSFKQYLRLGIEHILTGYDHLLFLAGLLVACRRLRTVLRIVTCFTIAHSITLALAALNVVALSSRVVEPLIAATIVFVGVENLLRGDEPTGRWALTFTFGLIHGFGFASVLREIGLGAAGAPLVAPLFAFNLGVELGQVAVAAVILPVLWALRRLPAFARHGRQLISVGVAGIGVYWLVERLAS